MKIIMIRTALVSLLLAVLLTGCEEQALQAVGQLESDRIELVAEFSEPIIAIQALEGDSLDVGSLVLSQDSSRIDISIEEARANIRRIEAILAEQLSGPRIKTIDPIYALCTFDVIYNKDSYNRLMLPTVAYSQYNHYY